MKDFMGKFIFGETLNKLKLIMLKFLKMKFMLMKLNLTPINKLDLQSHLQKNITQKAHLL